MSFSIKQLGARRFHVTRSLRALHIKQDNGYAIAEFAVVLPALLMVGLGLVSVLGIGATQISLNSRCAEVTRIIARGDQIPDSIARDTSTLIHVERHDGLLDVTLSEKKSFSLLGLHQDLVLTAQASALDELTL